MVIARWILLGFGIVRLLVALFNLASNPYLPCDESISTDKKVSVLVPARNEEANIEYLLENFAIWRDQVKEFIVYDDMSVDGTFAVAYGYSTSDNKLKVIRGSELPCGWLGKNHACQRLSTASSGEILLFIDADVRLSEHAVSRSVAYMEKHGLGLLSVFPTQIIDNPGSRLSVPLMNWILLSLLPLAAVRLSGRPSLSAANGQFIMFRASAYKKYEPHSRFRMSAVEDIAIVRYYKKERIKAATLLGARDVCCRMYNNFGEAVSGFSKNIFEFFGGSVIVTMLFIIGTTIAPFWIFCYNGIIPGLFYLLVIIAIRIFVSIVSYQNWIANIFLIIPQHITLWIITVNAIINKKRKTLTWKERIIS